MDTEKVILFHVSKTVCIRKYSDFKASEPA